MRSKTKKSTKKKNRGQRGNNVKKNQQPQREIPIEEILQAAEAAVTSCDVDKGIQLYSTAVLKLKSQQQQQISSSTFEDDILRISKGKWQLVRTLEKLGELKVSIGDQDGAVQDFREGLAILENQIPQDQKTNFDYYDLYSSLSMYIGQLCVEEEAKAAYEQGVTCLESCMKFIAENDNNSSSTTTRDLNQIQELNRKLCVAYCAVAELYLTDLCYEEAAESKCELMVEKALHIKDSTDGQPIIDALQTMASLRLSQATNSKRMEAVSYILRAYDKIRVGCEALANLVGITELNKDEFEPIELQNVDAANALPEFEFRCQTAKLLLECAELTKETPSSANNNQQDQCVTAAISVLGSLLAENDEVIEIWYLSGCAFAAKTIPEPQNELAAYYFRRSMEMLLDIKKALEQEFRFAEDDDDEQAEIQEQLEQNKSLLEDVQTRLQEAESTAMDTSS